MSNLLFGKGDTVRLINRRSSSVVTLPSRKPVGAGVVGVVEGSPSVETVTVRWPRGEISIVSITDLELVERF